MIGKDVLHTQQAEGENKSKQATLQKKIEDIAPKAERMWLKKKLTESIIFNGLWKTEHSVCYNVEGLSLKKEKVDALHSQIRFRKKGLG